VSLAFQLLFIASSIALLSLAYLLGIRRWDSAAKTSGGRRFGRRYYLLLFATFAAGATTRALEPGIGSETSNALAAIFGGIFVSLIGIPYIYLLAENRVRGIKLWLSALIFGLALFGGLCILTFGVFQLTGWGT